MNRADFNRAWEERARKLPTSHAQRRRIAELSAQAGIELPDPFPFWDRDAEKLIDRLDRMVREPTLFSGATEVERRAVV